MDSKEISKELSMPYYELVEYLKGKYGEAKYDYFHTESCKSKNRKVTRTSEGLLCHHIEEVRGEMLSNPASAIKYPYEWQKKENLVYCNYIEHLILHIKIDIMFASRGRISAFAVRGIPMICGEINEMYTAEPKAQWKKNCFEAIKENKEDYIKLLKVIVLYGENALKKKLDVKLLTSDFDGRETPIYKAFLNCKVDEEIKTNLESLWKSSGEKNQEVKIDFADLQKYSRKEEQEPAPIPITPKMDCSRRELEKKIKNTPLRLKKKRKWWRFWEK